MATILQAPLLTDFLYPMLLVFFIVFAILEKTGILGDSKKQLNAGVALVISLIFVGAVFPKIIVANLVQFMSVGLVIIFVALMLWGFVSGDGKLPDGIQGPMGWIIGIAVFFAVLWATGIGAPIITGLQKLLSFLFSSSWSGSFWTNALFIGIIAIGIAVVLKAPKVVAPAAGK
jgi:hypothetical protein